MSSYITINTCTGLLQSSTVKRNIYDDNDDYYQSSTNQYLNSSQIPTSYSVVDTAIFNSIAPTRRHQTAIGTYMQHYLNSTPEQSCPSGLLEDISTSHQIGPWSMYHFNDTNNSMGYTAVSPANGLKRQRSHQRTTSASTIASNGPASPFASNISCPQIANTDYDPSQVFSKDLSTANSAYLSPHYIPKQAVPDHGIDMKAFSLHNNHYEDLSPSSARTSMSLDTRDDPMTPDSVHEEEVKQDKNVPTFKTSNPQVQLFRTESAAFQDELYNPANFAVTPSSSLKPKASPTSSARSVLMNQRLETANQSRSAPNSISRDRSPFREGTEYASEGWTGARPMATASSRRQAAKEEREEQEYMKHRPVLQREPTKTISPKDALLDYTDTDQPLFQDTVPIGYAKHFGTSTDAASASLANAYLEQSNNPTSFTLPPSSQNSMAGFRASSADNSFANTTFNFTPPTIPASTTAANAYMNNYQQLSHLAAPNYAATSMDPTPDFPAHLTSMESSISEGPPMSSQESGSAMLQRPTDTRANTGTYTCTFQNCTQRFESQPLLQKHKREFHHSQQNNRDSLSVGTSSVSPRSTASPAPTSGGSGLTSAQILARNSQAGPHKCTRINPSTGKPCNTIFSRPYDLTRHEDTIHNGRKQKVRCPYCREEKTFSRNDALTRHMRVVHPDVENFGKRGRRGD